MFFVDIDYTSSFVLLFVGLFPSVSSEISKNEIWERREAAFRRSKLSKKNALTKKEYLHQQKSFSWLKRISSLHEEYEIKIFNFNPRRPLRVFEAYIVSETRTNIEPPFKFCEKYDALSVSFTTNKQISSTYLYLFVFFEWFQMRSLMLWWSADPNFENFDEHARHVETLTFFLSTEHTSNPHEALERVTQKTKTKHGVEIPT